MRVDTHDEFTGLTRMTDARERERGRWGAGGRRKPGVLPCEARGTLYHR